MYKNGTAPSSKTQRYLNSILKGELNYPIDKCRLDIAFPDKKIYVEYDGSGHDVSVTAYGASREKFDRNEIRRKAFLQSLGWKIIRIISRKDFLFEEKLILELIKDAEKYLNSSQHTWFEIDIDELKVRCSQFENEISDVKILRKITKEYDDSIYDFNIFNV